MDGAYYQTTVDHWPLRLVEYIIEPLQNAFARDILLPSYS